MTRSALRAATIATIGALFLGMVFSLVARQFGWIDRLNWLAFLIVPIVVGVLVYVAVRFGKSRGAA
jgi:high-affinity Fe2+/Pb2+ permease